MTIKNDENSANRKKQGCQALEIFSEQWFNHVKNYKKLLCAHLTLAATCSPIKFHKGRI